MPYPIRPLYCFVLMNVLLLAACIPAQGDAQIPREVDCATVVGKLPPESPVTKSQAVEIRVAAHGYREYCWQLYGPFLAAHQLVNPPIHVSLQPYTKVSATDVQLLEQAFAAHEAPDLIQFASADLPTLVHAGYLTPLDTCRRQHAAFANVLDEAWSAATDGGQIWAIPYQIGLTHFYFNKIKLHAMGWSTDEIQRLPQKIEQGEFTLENLLQTARTAIATGVVEPGFGYWPNLDDPWSLQLAYAAYGGRLFDPVQGKLVVSRAALTKAYAFQRQMIATGITQASFVDLNHSFLDKTLWEDTVTHGRVLFWTAANYNWAMLTTDYQDDWEPDNDVQAMLGYSLFPSGEAGKPGRALWLNTGLYGIPTATFTGRSHQAVACALLAQTLTPAINGLESARSGFMSVLQDQATNPLLEKYPFSLAQMGLWRHAVVGPERHPAYAAYMTTLNNLLPAVQAGALAAGDATELVILQLRQKLDQQKLDNDLLVED